MTDAAASGQLNEGFSHTRGSTHSIDVYSDPPRSQPAPQTTLSINDRPPSYDSLLTSFNMTSLNSTSQDTIVTYDAATARNRQARVRYRGELSSNQMLRLENIVPAASPDRASIPRNRPSDATPRQTSQARQSSHDHNPTTSTVNTATASNEDADSRQQTTTNEMNELRPQRNNEASIEVRNTRPSSEASSEIVARENSSHSIIVNATPSPEQPSDINLPMIRTPQPSPIQLSTDLDVANEEGNRTHLSFTDQTPTHLTPSTDHPPTMEPEREVVRHESTIPHTGHSSDMVDHGTTFIYHTPLRRTVSDNSEDGVYIDITPNRHPVSPVRYTECMNLTQTQPHATHEQEDQSVVGETAHQDMISLNSNPVVSEQDANSSNRDIAQEASPIVDNKDESWNGNLRQRGSESSSSSEAGAVTNHADTNSVSSLEIMSI